MPKKPIRNAFYFYMVEFRQNQREKGITYSNMAEVQRAADPSWKTLSLEEKAKYTKMAKKDNTKQNVIVDEVKEQEMIDAAELQIIKNFIKQRAFNNDLIEEDFFIMDVNSYCYCNFQSRYLIGECTVLRFSVLEGVKDHFHKSINIGQIPIGYAADVKWSCKEFGLEEPAEDQPPTNLGSLLQSLIKYMRGTKQDTNLPPLYAIPEKIPEIKDFILQMCAAAGEDPSRFSVYKLESLFYYLNNEISLLKLDKIAKIAVAKTMLLKDHFWYIYNGLGCEKHDDPVEENMKPLECTKSRVSRWAFRILERSCLVAGIDPVVGRHVPLKADNVDVLLRQVKEKRDEAMKPNRGSSVDGASSIQKTLLLENSIDNTALTSWNSLKETLKEQAYVPPSSYNKNVANDSDSLYGAGRGTRVNETRTCSEASFNTIETQDITFERDSMASNASFFPVHVRNEQSKSAHIPKRMPIFNNQVIKPVPAVTENVRPIIQVGRGRGFITISRPSNDNDSWDD